MNRPDHIRSFASRLGRFSPAQRQAVQDLTPAYGLSFAPTPTDLKQQYLHPEAPFVLEIGSGMGEATALIAGSMPDTNYLACEVYPAGVGALLKRIDAARLKNLKVIQHDAFEVVRDMIAPSYLDGAHIFFPDPWHKARHHKRRLVQPPFIAMLVSRIKIGGYLHLATDWVPYSEQMMEVLSAEPTLRNRFAGFADKPPYRTLSKFENRGVKLGHEVRDLIFERIA